MFSPSTGDVFFKATQLAQQSGAPEIEIDILLAALDAPAVSSQLGEVSDTDSFEVFVNSDLIPMSDEVVRALTPFGGLEKIENITLDTFRTALLSARERRSNTE